MGSIPQHSRLRIWHCCSYGVGHSCNSDSISGQGTSICHGCGHKNIFLIKAEEIKNIEYDKIEQKLKFDVLDSNGNTIVFDIKYNSVSENAIKYFEKNKTGSYFEYILGSITEKNGIMNGKFISGIQDGKIKNIFF